MVLLNKDVTCLAFRMCSLTCSFPCHKQQSTGFHLTCLILNNSKSLYFDCLLDGGFKYKQVLIIEIILKYDRCIFVKDVSNVKRIKSHITRVDVGLCFIKSTMPWGMKAGPTSLIIRLISPELLQVPTRSWVD